jgi:two-component system response regulator YesN
MYKLLIVDDEKIVLEGLTSAINWQEHQIEVVETASNGHEAFQCIINNPPQIVLADIQMPGLNGLDLIQKVKKVYPDIVFIIISGYTEFDYAKRAIELEAVDYLVKPIEIDEIISVVKKGIIKYEKMKAEKENNDQIQKYQMELEEKDILNLILGRTIDKNNFETLNRFKRWKLLVAGFKSTIWKNNIEKADKGIFNRFKKPFEERGYESFIYYIEDFIITLYANSIRKEVQDSFIIEYSSLLHHELNTTPIIGVSNTYYDFSYIRQSFQEAKESFEIGIYLDQLITHNKDLEKMNNTVGNEIIEKINQCFKQNNFKLDKMSLLIQEIFNYSIENMISPVKSKYLCFMVINNVFEYVQHEFDLKIERILGDKYQLYEELNKLPSIEEIRYWLENLVNKIFDYVNENRVSYKDKLILDVKSYLQKNYNQSIILDEIAQDFHISPAYLSSLFSKTVKMTIFEYITNIRMNKAKELLRTTNYKILDICNDVGYKDTKYFNQVFKKQVGLTPSQYRSKHLIVNI